MQNSSDPILATLMFAELGKKKKRSLPWDGNKVWGRAVSEESDRSQKTAREAPVFAVTAPDSSQKIPTSCCLLNGLSASVKRNLLQQNLYKLEETGICVVAVVRDGAATNRVGIKRDVINSQCWFPDSTLR